MDAHLNMTDYSARLAALRAEPSTDAPHDVARLARVERTRTEMMSQGDAIAATLAAEAERIAAVVSSLEGRQITQVVITGCGDSWFVGMAVKHVFESLLGVPCLAAQAFDYALYDHVSAGPSTLAIGLSSGGSTPAVMAALDRAKARGAFAIGVSNTAGSAVMTTFDLGLQVHARRSGWPTQSSTAAIALLSQLALGLAQRNPASAVAQARLAGELALISGQAAAFASSQDALMQAAAGTFANAGSVLFTGAGPCFAAACFGAAKVRELCPVHAFALPLEEMHHYRLPKKGDHLVIVAPDAPSRERAFDTVLVGEAVGARMVAVLGAPDREIAARVRHVVEVPHAAGLLAAITASVPLHLLAYHLAIAMAAVPADGGGA
jgi:glucosamine--fructose-6-phosphate aminotransferase (isomerizing)